MIETQNSTVALRVARADEHHLIRRIADLDDTESLDGMALVAFVDGEAVAALSLYDGRVIANPFVRTAEAVALLRLRAAHLSGPRRRRWRVPWLRPRMA